MEEEAAKATENALDIEVTSLRNESAATEKSPKEATGNDPGAEIAKVAAVETITEMDEPTLADIARESSDKERDG